MKTTEDRAPRLFGTNGVRGVVNTDQMDSHFALRLGTAIGTFMDGTVMVATDARTSNEMLKSACVAGVLSTGCEVLDLGIVPTPAIQYAVKRHKAAGGVMITASHNPPEFNGIKCIDPDGTEMARKNEETIERIYHTKEFRRVTWDRVGRPRGFPTAAAEYVEGIVSAVDSEAIRKADLRIAVDCGNGAAAFTTPKLLERLGVRYVTLNADPNGAFPGHNSEPVPENAKDLIELVKTGGFAFGVIHDGDADRSIFVDDRGRYMYGDRSLALIAHHKVKAAGGGLVVTTVGSSKCVEDATRMAKGRIMYTRVGSPIVARAMMEHGAVFGGEENGGLIFPELQHCRDGGMAVAAMLEAVAKNGSLAGQLDRIPSYSQFKTKTVCPDDRKEKVMTALSKTTKEGRVDTTDGVKIFFEDGWVLVRPSGTEPLFRIFTEAKTPERAQRIAEEYLRKVQKLVKA